MVEGYQFQFAKCLSESGVSAHHMICLRHSWLKLCQIYCRQWRSQGFGARGELWQWPPLAEITNL